MKRSLLLLAVLAGMVSQAFATSTLTVTVKNQNAAPVNGATVFVLTFSSTSGNPDGALSQIGVTTSTGVLTFTIEDNRDYTVLATVQGSTPTIRDQIFNTNQTPVNSATPSSLNKTITLTSGLTGVGQVTANLILPGTPRSLMGDIFNTSTFEPVAFGMTTLNATPGTFTLLNVPTASSTSTYRFRVFSPADGKGMEIPVDQAVTNGGSITIGTAMDFTSTNAIAPPRQQDTERQAGVGVAFEGVVKSTNSVPIENVRVFLMEMSTAGQGQFHQTRTDSNGYYSFFNITSSSYTLEFTGNGYYGTRLDNNGQGYFYDGQNKLVLSTVLPQANGVISGQVVLQGVGGVPDAWVGVYGNYDVWQGGDFFAIPSTRCYSQEAGRGEGNVRTDGNGNFTISGLAPGNYNLQAFSSFSQQPVSFNDGANNQRETTTRSCTPYGFTDQERTGDDFRVTVTTSGAFEIRDHVGNLQSPTLIIQIPRSTQATLPLITGTIAFDPPATLGANETVAVIAHGEFDPSATTSGPPPGGFASIPAGSYSLANPAPFQIFVPTGTRYFVEVRSNNYGVKNQDFEPVADLKNFVIGVSSPVGMNFIMAPAGKIQGIVRLPDGKIFRPNYESSSAESRMRIDAEGEDVIAHGGGDPQDTGVFEISGLIPGRYSLRGRGEGAAFQWTDGFLDHVPVQVGQTTKVEIRLKDGVRIDPVITLDPLPSGATEHFYTILHVQDGEDLKKVAFDRLENGDRDRNSPVSIDQDRSQAGQPWHNKYLPSGKYTFYLCYGQDYGPERNSENHFITVLSSQSLTVGRDFATSTGSGTFKMNLVMSGSLGNAVLKGKMIGDNIFTQYDADKFKNDFDQFVNFIPRMVLLDSAGNFKAISMEVPPTVVVSTWIAAAASGDVTQLRALLNTPATKPQYRIEGVPTGTYTAIATTPNYPPVTQRVTVPAIASGSIADVGNGTTLDVDFGSSQYEAGGTIRGTIRDKSSSTVLGDVTIKIQNKSFEKTVNTNSLGTFLISGLPRGTYRVQASKSGYAPAGAKKTVENNTITADLFLQPTSCSIQGTVYAQKMPYPQTLAGAKIVAYDDTANGLDPAAFLPLLEAKTQSDGTYLLDGIINTHTYKISIIVNGKSVETISKDVTACGTTGVDFTLKSEAPKIHVRARTEGTAVLFDISSPKSLTSLTAEYSEGFVFISSASTSVTSSLVAGPNNTWTLSVSPPDSSKFYTLRLLASDGATTQTMDTIFSLSVQAQTLKALDEELVAGGEVDLGTETDGTSIEMPVGGVTQSTGSALSPGHFGLVGGFASAIAQVGLSKTDRTLSEKLLSISNSIMASDVYELELANAQLNKSLTLTLGYDKDAVTDPSVLKIYQYNDATGTWEFVPGTRTVDPVNGTISVDIESIADATASAQSAMSSLSLGRAQFTGRAFVVSRAATTQSGTFVVFSAQPSTNIAFAGGALEAYNFPNPFNLKSKTLVLRTGGALGGTFTTTGTMIHYSLPASQTGRIQFHIYNLSGDLIRTLDDGVRTGGFEYYAEWDGLNKDGEPVASGVYFCQMKKDGDLLKTFKMAVLK